MPTNRKSKARIAHEVFHPWETVFLSGHGSSALNKWEAMGLRDLEIGQKARPGDRTPKELRAAWRELGHESFEWKDFD
jgi:hypothetical protein